VVGLTTGATDILIQFQCRSLFKSYHLIA
jgi:hypothetical protein